MLKIKGTVIEIAEFPHFAELRRQIAITFFRFGEKRPKQIRVFLAHLVFFICHDYTSLCVFVHHLSEIRFFIFAGLNEIVGIVEKSFLTIGVERMIINDQLAFGL